MKLITLTSRSRSKIYINVETIVYMYEKDDCTVIGVNDMSFEVKETVVQVFQALESKK